MSLGEVMFYRRNGYGEDVDVNEKDQKEEN